MAPFPHVALPFELRIATSDFDLIEDHLFPGDSDEHGAVLLCGMTTTAAGTRLLVHDVALAEDGIDYLPGIRGYRMLRDRFVRQQIRRARDEGLVYLAVHNHHGHDHVAFSTTDLASHERGYPALLEIAAGQPVGALVLNHTCIAGDIWLPDGTRHPLGSAVTIGQPIDRRYSSPRDLATADDGPSRQTALYGDRGHAIMRNTKVAVVGLGGVGMLLVHLLAGLRVGSYILIDDDKVEPSNLPRLPGARKLDAMPWLWRKRDSLIHRLGRKLARHKVAVARRIIRTADPDAHVATIVGDISSADIAHQLTDCDHIFLAADSFRARNAINALAHAHLIPTTQIGSQVETDDAGTITNIFGYVRLILPDGGCLTCNGLIPPARLQEETVTAEHARGQRYVDDPDVFAPSVITLNARPTSIAADLFMLAHTGLATERGSPFHLRIETLGGRHVVQEPRRDPTCRHCSNTGYRARGDSAQLPLRRD